MAFVLGTEEMDFKPSGTKCTVPNYDVSKLSYYLNCVTKGCGLDVIKDPKIIDYQMAYMRKHERQNNIFLLASQVFDINTMLDKVVFVLRDGHHMLEGRDNRFYKVEKVSNLLAIDSVAVIAGTQTQVTEIMVCNRSWLESYHHGPIRRNQARINRIVAQAARSTQRTTSSDVDVAIALLAALVVSAEQATSDHCDHCDGLNGRVCGCQYGCPMKASSQCVVVHEAICDGCRAQIQDNRYNCGQCYNYDLCGECYTSGVHDMTHRFTKIARPGCNGETLQPRRKAPVAPPRIAQPRRKPPATPPRVARATVTDNFSPTHVADAPLVQADPVSVSVDSFYTGQDVELVNMADNRRNGWAAKVVRSIGEKIVVDLTGRNQKLTVRPNQVKAIQSLIPLGTLVELHGLLSHSHRNGQLALVVADYKSAASGEQRVSVEFLHDNTKVSVKLENCTVIEDAT